MSSGSRIRPIRRRFPILPTPGSDSARPERESGFSSPPTPDSSSSKNPNDAQCATMQADTSPLIFLVAGEPSGDEIGGRLMSALRTVAGEDVRFAGIGGKAMTSRGLRTLFPIEEPSVMGLVEVLAPGALHHAADVGDRRSDPAPVSRCGRNDQRTGIRERRLVPPGRRRCSAGADDLGLARGKSTQTRGKNRPSAGPVSFRAALLRGGRARLHLRRSSGTVTLDLALAGVPIIVAYRLNPLTVSIMRRMISIRHFHDRQPDLDRPAIPEFFQERCTGDRLAEPALRLLLDADARRTQREAAATALAALRPQGKSPSVRAAEVILDVVRRRSGARIEQGAFR